MKRRVVKQGAATLTISLPSKWTKKFNIKPGDEIDVEEAANNLLIKNNAETAISKTDLDIQTLPKAIAYRFLIGAYKKGSDEINVTFSPQIEDLKTNKKQKTIDFIQETINKLIGVEIIEQAKNHCKIKQITAVSDDDFEIVLRRIFLLLLSLSEESFEIITKSQKNIETIKNKHDNVDKFVNYCIRLLNKTNHEKTTLYYYLIQQLEEISDTYTYIIEEFIKSKKKLDKKTIDIFKQTNDSLRTFYEYFYDFKKEKAIKIIKDRRKIFNSINLLKSHPDNLLLSRLAVIIVNILNLTETRISML